MFVTKALSGAQANPAMFPGSFSQDAFWRDVDLFAKLTELTTLANHIAEQISSIVQDRAYALRVGTSFTRL